MKSSTKAPEKIAYCQVDAHLDTNPKIRRAGRDGRDVFEFLLRRVAIGCTAGTVPIRYIEPWYLADILMMSEDEAKAGTSRAVTAGLIEIDVENSVINIVGWTEEWGRRPKEGKERTKDWRAKKAKSHDGVTTRDACDDAASHVTVGDESDAGEERRREEKREQSVSGKPDAALAFAEKAVALINANAGTKYQPTSEAVLKLCRTLIRNKHTLEQAERVIASKRGWVGDPKMGPFFRPATLLAAKNFATYLDDIEAGPTLFAQGTHTMRLPTPDDDEPDLTYAGFGMGAST